MDGGSLMGHAAVGLNGILASLYCRRVVMTDYDEKVVNLLHRNIRHNAHRSLLPAFTTTQCSHVMGTVGTDMQAAKLRWGEGVAEFNKRYGPFDIIIGSGCV